MDIITVRNFQIIGQINIVLFQTVLKYLSLGSLTLWNVSRKLYRINADDICSQLQMYAIDFRNCSYNKNGQEFIKYVS